MASAPLLLAFVAAVAPAALKDQVPAQVLTLPVRQAATDADDRAVDIVPVAAAPRKKTPPPPAFVPRVENPPVPSDEPHLPPLAPARPGAPRGPPSR